MVQLYRLFFIANLLLQFINNGFYLVVIGIIAMKRPRFMALASICWCLRQVPLRCGGNTLACPEMNLRNNSASL